MLCTWLHLHLHRSEVQLGVFEWGRGFGCGLGRGALPAVADLGFYEEGPSERCIPPFLSSPLLPLPPILSPFSVFFLILHASILSLSFRPFFSTPLHATRLTNTACRCVERLRCPARRQRRNSSLICADVLLRNYSPTHPLSACSCLIEMNE